MRTIKFRGKRKDNGEWIYGDLVHNTWGYFIINHFAIHNDKIVSVIEAEVLPETVGQFTGLYDKNGVEIYEGDIVKIPNDYELYGQFAGEVREIFHKHMQLEKILYNYEQTNTELVIKEYSEETLNEFGIITDFVSKLINNSKQLDKEFAEALNKGFWEII